MKLKIAFAAVAATFVANAAIATSIQPLLTVQPNNKFGLKLMTESLQERTASSESQRRHPQRRG